MTETAEQPGVESEQAQPGGSILDSLRQAREEAGREATPTLALDVPGYAPRSVPSPLAVLYRYPEAGYKPAVRALERAEQRRDPDARLTSASDLLIAACASVVGRLPDGRLCDLLTDRPLGEDEVPDPPLRFDRRLAGALNIEVPEEVRSVPRHVLRELYSPRAAEKGIYDGDLALLGAGNQLLMWLNGREAVLDEELLGE